uniref:Uncharacterized protein n=1 Tax=Anguilla anguilla TaxID=7936 RepID=A0A0E9URQ7_ANGAN
MCKTPNYITCFSHTPRKGTDRFISTQLSFFHDNQN